jgi:hypothetical protein
MKTRIIKILKPAWWLFGVLFFAGGCLLMLSNLYTGQPLLSEDRLGIGTIIMIVMVLYFIDKERRKSKNDDPDTKG